MYKKEKRWQKYLGFAELFGFIFIGGIVALIVIISTNPGLTGQPWERAEAKETCLKTPKKPDLYSQIGQDEFAAKTNSCKRGGVFLDIGAYHPEKYSNTVLLERELGWTGFCVDPFPDGDWKTRKCKLDKIVLFSDSKEQVFRKAQNLGGIDKLLRSEIDFKPFETVKIKPELPMEYFKRVGMPKIIDYLSMDTEGSEYDILNSIDWNNFCARVITVENYPKKSKIEGLLTKHGCTKTGYIGNQDDFYICKCGSK